MAKVKVNQPNRPKDDDIEVTGLGVFKNGSTTEVDDATVQVYLAQNPDANWDGKGTLTLDHSEADRQRKAATDPVEDEGGTR